MPTLNGKHASTAKCLLFLQVYQFFLVMYRISRTLGLLGYTLLLINTVNGGAVGSAFHLPKDAFIDLLWYGLYFGILGRDCAEVASDSMVSAFQQGCMNCTDMHSRKVMHDFHV